MDMGGMFRGAWSFNMDVPGVSNVTNMRGMLNGATSFTHQLTGAWSTSTADKSYMFQNCPGSIAGKTSNGDGTPV